MEHRNQKRTLAMICWTHQPPTIEHIDSTPPATQYWPHLSPTTQRGVSNGRWLRWLESPGFANAASSRDDPRGTKEAKSLEPGHQGPFGGCREEDLAGGLRLFQRRLLPAATCPEKLGDFRARRRQIFGGAGSCRCAIDCALAEASLSLSCSWRSALRALPVTRPRCRFQAPKIPFWGAV